MNSEPFVIDRAFNAPVEKIWRAITDKQQMKQWYFDTPAFKPETGAKFSFTARDKDGRDFVHLCTVLEVIPNKKLTHSWRYEGYDGDSLVTWELFDEGNKTRVKLTHAGLETFPAIKGFAKENFAEGWLYIVDTSLKNFIAA
ncbi:MAG TPA: SRPBCC domain-containing protein [Puia sp.]|nr:SRPBCC domain-containing protein [Puia sp.]